MSESSLPSRTDFWSKEEEEKELLHFINQAEDVDSLKKIGLNNKQAENVLKFKAYHGPLKSLDELLKISGIGERTVAKVKLLGAPKPQGKISVQAQEHPRKPSKVMNSNKEREKRERLLSALILGGVVFSISYFGLLAIANNGRAWFIASCIVSSLVLLFVLLGVLGTWFAKADPDRIKNLFVAVPFFISMLFGVVLALTKAPGQFPPSPSSASSSSVAQVKPAGPHAKPEPVVSSSTTRQRSISVPAFRIENLRDASFANCVRIVADVLILEKKALTDEQLVEIARRVVDKITATRRVNAIGVFFWYSADAIGNQAAAASVDWAPYGEWGEASTVPTGDYSKHSFKVDFNNTHVFSPPKTTTTVYITDPVYAFKDPEFLALALSATTMDEAAAVTKLGIEMGICTFLEEGTPVADVDFLIYPPWVLVKVRVLSTGEEYWVPAEVVGTQ